MSDAGRGLARLNAMPREEAAAVLRSCCGSKRWAAAMAGARPFASVDTLMAESEAWWNWKKMTREDLLEAFSHHPRIGERNMTAFGEGAAQASKEQSGMALATEAQRREFAAGNEAYERKFGHVFLIFASGKTPEQMLEQLRARMNNDGETELANAAAEQAKITRLRLERWLAS